MERALLVFDVGKTNKKLLVYDEALNLVTSRFQSFSTKQLEGVEVEPIEDITGWFLDGLSELARSYPIRSISVTTHGAGLVCLDELDQPAVPVVSYTHEPENAGRLHEEFYALVGNRQTLQRETATIELQPLVNPAKLIFFLKKQYPEAFPRTKRILFYPQYFAYLLTGSVVADFTYVGCHTYLWDFERRDWSHVADSLGVRELLPERVVHPWETIGRIRPEIASRQGVDPDTVVAAGIHDSNASILPYLLKESGDFVLNSTGTWCVAMRPARDVRFESEEIGKAVFFNQSAFGTPVKTSILIGGLEFDTYSELIGPEGRDAPPDIDLFRQIVREQRYFILPSVLKGVGQFPTSEPRVVEDGREFPLADIKAGKVRPGFFDEPRLAYAVLNLSLALQSKVALQRVGLRDGEQIYIEGGFRNNLAYTALLAGFFPRSRAALTTLKEATSFGGAMVARAALTGEDPNAMEGLFEITPNPIEPMLIEGIADYESAFTRKIG
ncbi:MAG: FGGY-family carbohydrate kinase [Spirochaetota bacterium]